jgi:alkylation response protein AidB-like acyl-CoA dehydrogenase
MEGCTMTNTVEPQADAVVMETIAAFCDEVLPPKAAEIDAREIFTTRHRKALSDVGYMRLNVPAALGGFGVDPFTLFETIAPWPGRAPRPGRW